jgi:hypothetical protein
MDGREREEEKRGLKTSDFQKFQVARGYGWEERITKKKLKMRGRPNRA